MFPTSFFIQNVVNLSFSFLAGLLLTTYSLTYSPIYFAALTGRKYQIHIARLYLFFLTSLCSFISIKYQERYEKWCMYCFHASFILCLIISALEGYIAPFLFSLGVEIVIFVVCQIISLGYILSYLYFIIKSKIIYTNTKVFTVEECSICFQCHDEQVSIKLICGHIFHQTCIETWFEHKKEAKSCPNCRFTIV